MKLLHQGNHTLSLARRNNLDFPPHLQNAVEVIYLMEGTTTALCGGSKICLCQGDLLIVFPNQVHSFENSADVSALLMIIPVDPYLEHFRNTMEKKLPIDPILHWEQWQHTNLDMLLKEAHKEWKTAPKSVLQGYILLVIGKILPLLTLQGRDPGNTDALHSALLYLHQHYTEPVSRRQIATALGYHESYLSHIFSETLHTTLTDYVLNLRISDAVRLLETTDMTVSQISATVGFGSIRSFNRAFLKATGLTPRQYRKTQTG